jgi:ribosomal protein L37AE/L43A
MSALCWLLFAPLLTGAFIGLIVTFWTESDDVVVSYLLLGCAVLVLLLRLRLASAGARARILAGHSPFGCFSAPRTPEELTARLCAMWDYTGQRPSVVGSGWGWFISRESAPRAVYTHRLKGRYGTSRTTFLAGTELRDVEKALRRDYKRTFWSTPSMQRISIGSWLGRSCHGNSGAAGKPSSYAAGSVYIIDMDTRTSTANGPYWEHCEVAKELFDVDPERYTLVAVEFDLNRMVNDMWLQKRKVEVGVQRHIPNADLLHWLTPDAVLRVLFFGSARDKGIGVTYVPHMQNQPIEERRECYCCGRMVPHIDPHDCSAACMSMQLDTCSLVCGWYERASSHWRGIIKLSDANAFSPDPSWLGFPIIALLSFTVNYELIFLLAHDDESSAIMRVQKLCNTLLHFYKRVWGRSELRMQDPNKGLVFVDCITSERDAPHLIEAICPHVHHKIVALHNGKFQGRSVTNAIAELGLVRETPRVIFQMHY